MRQEKALCQILDVSIPHGTIKSYFYVHNRLVWSNVSIPHGTIKRLSNLKTNIDVSAFQFHMVRLKVTKYLN